VREVFGGERFGHRGGFRCLTFIHIRLIPIFD
jgi:hypothetical protein